MIKKRSITSYLSVLLFSFGFAMPVIAGLASSTTTVDLSIVEECDLGSKGSIIGEGEASTFGLDSFRVSCSGGEKDIAERQYRVGADAGLYLDQGVRHMVSPKGEKLAYDLTWVDSKGLFYPQVGTGLLTSLPPEAKPFPANSVQSESAAAAFDVVFRNSQRAKALRLKGELRDFYDKVLVIVEY